MYEPAVRVPLLIKPPGPLASVPRRHTWDLTTHADLTATLLAYAGADPLPGSDGFDLGPASAGRSDTGPTRDIIHACFDGNAGLAFTQRMVRSRTHKLIHNVGHAPELYDLVEDPHETRSLTRAPEARGVLHELTRQLNGWMDEHDDDAPRLQDSGRS